MVFKVLLMVRVRVYPVGIDMVMVGVLELRRLMVQVYGVMEVLSVLKVRHLVMVHLLVYMVM